MQNETALYHGSQEIIRSPEYGAGRLHNDYGRGFYCTESAELAREWACTSVGGGFSNHYVLDMTGMKVLELNSDEYSVLNWMAVLVQHRLFSLGTPIAGKAKKYLSENFYVNVDAYDVVIGYRADDAYYSFADLFLNNGITVEQLARAMKLGRLGEQIVLKSKWSFDNMRFIDFEAVDHMLYYPKRKARADRAGYGFAKISEEDSEGLFMADIIRERITNDDERIPRNVSAKRDE